MNNKGFFSLILLILINILHAQAPEFKAPDYDLIQKNIKDNKSEFYYPDLLKKLKENDTVMTQEQYRHLYFGQIFQKDYSSLRISKKMDEMGKYYRGEKTDLAKGIQLFREALEEDPMDIRAMNYLAFMYHKNNDEATAKRIAKSFHGLLGAILSSGDGLKCETGFHVTSVSHEYVLMNMFQLETTSQSYDGKCDFQQFEKDKYKIPGMYFNVSKLYDGMFGK